MIEDDNKQNFIKKTDFICCQKYSYFFNLIPALSLGQLHYNYIILHINELYLLSLAYLRISLQLLAVILFTFL